MNTLVMTQDGGSLMVGKHWMLHENEAGNLAIKYIDSDKPEDSFDFTFIPPCRAGEKKTN